jgi:hypothetical protein
MKHCKASAGLFLALVSLTGSSQYTAYVKNFTSCPLTVKPLKHGAPGFTVENKSKRPITQWRLGCVKKTNDNEVVTFAFIPWETPLGPKTPQSQTTFKTWTPEQVACSNRASAIAILEVLFADGKSWAAPIEFEKVLDAGKRGFVIP